MNLRRSKRGGRARPRAAWAGALAASLVARAAGLPTPIELDAVPLLFVDDTPIAAQRGVVRTFHPACTRPAPVLEPDRPWEGGRAYTYGSLHYDDAGRRFWLWYMAMPPRPDAASPGKPPVSSGSQRIGIGNAVPPGWR